MMRSKKQKIIVLMMVLLALLLLATLKIRNKPSKWGTLSEPLQKGSIIESVYGIGTVTAEHRYQLKLGAVSTIQRLYVNEGSRVKKGDKLIDLEDMGSFKAPFEGTVTFLPVKEGETVFAQSLILDLVDLQDRYLVVSLEQRGALRVRQGQKARINFDSLRDESYDGRVESVYAHDNNFYVRIGVAGLPSQFLPGMTGDVAIGVAERSGVLLAPVAAIESGKVYLKDTDAKPKMLLVKTGIVDGAMAEIVAGELREGDVLYIRQKLTP